MAESKKFKCCIEEYDFLSVHLHREDKEVFITVNNEIDDSAGMPEKSKSFVTFENFKQGSSYEGKLRPVTVNGGVVLEEILFTIK